MTDLRTRLDDHPSKRVGWAPHPGGQQAFLTSPIFETLLEGNRGGGKTICLLMDYLQHVDKGYGRDWRGVLFRRTYDELLDVIEKSLEWFEILSPKARYNHSKHHWRWPDGEMLLFRYIEKPRDYRRYHGHAYPWIGFEELTNWPTPDVYLLMMSCCRSTNPDLPRKHRATTNSSGLGHNWVKARFKLPLLPGHRHGKVIEERFEFPAIAGAPPRVEILQRVAGRVMLEENRSLIENDPGYQGRIAMSATSESQLRAWLYDDWDIVSGGMFDDVWQPAAHVVPRFEIPPTWDLDRSFDWGSTKPYSVGWWAESDGSPLIVNGLARPTLKGDLFRVAELYGWNGEPNVGTKETPRDVAEKIIELEAERFPGRKVEPGPADVAIFSSDHGQTVAEQMEEAGVTWDRANMKGTEGKSSRIGGAERLRSLLKQALPNKDGTPREHEGLFVTEDCEQFIRTIPVLPRDEKKPDDADTKAEDHVYDESRYRCYTARHSVTAKPIRGR